ncbi:HAD family hydrolase [Knoellia subterranea]|uniref:Haloacid dehalogenase n=1 Tax=Knoellia subterranea KCTC 19937 TaxID=1385521 RepID=A0A0A0JKW1_9MICO|nr:HAD family hydrolase [Knoellia subterranea]KGN36697.1 haloacid dehalogenase [Knoellia subterranea KCTC 19937]
MTFAGVLLDADDTLYDTRAAMHRAGAEVAHRLWPHADPARLEFVGVRFRDDPEGWFAAYTRGELDFDDMRTRRIDEIGRWLGSEEVVEPARFFALYEPAFHEALEAFDDVHPTVAALRESGRAVGILTNSSADYTDTKLAASGLDGVFDVICSRDTLGFGKPDPRAFHEACRRLGTDPSETLYVGDDLHTDPLGANGAGMPAAWLVRDGHVAEADRKVVSAHGIPVVSGLAEVADLGAGEGRR